MSCVFTWNSIWFGIELADFNLQQELFFGLPTTIDGVLKPHEDVVRMLDIDTISYGDGIGANSSSSFTVGAFGQCVFLELKVEVRPLQYVFDANY
jgi:hypothetical protein